MRFRAEAAVAAAMLAIAVVLLALALVPERSGSGGMEHARVPHMQQGAPEPPGAAVTVLGWAFGALSLALFAALAALGTRTGAGLRGVGRPLAAVTLLCLALWSAVVLTSLAPEPEPALVFGFPLPTALLVYGLWPASTLFAVLYVAGFERWVFSARDRARYEELLRERRERAGGTGEPAR